MAYIMVDVESDGPIPGDFSMISFGAVLVNDQLDKTFYGQLKPISEKFIPEARGVWILFCSVCFFIRLMSLLKPTSVINDDAGLSVSIPMLSSRQLLHLIYIILQALYKAGHKGL